MTTSQITPEAVDATNAARMLDMGRTTWLDWVAKGWAPQPTIRRGKVVRWSTAQVKAVANGEFNGANPEQSANQLTSAK